MIKRRFLLCFLLILITAFSNIAFANAPYANIMAFTENTYNANGVKGPNMSALNVLNIINLTPWEIYVGDPTQPDNNMLPGFAGKPLVGKNTNPLSVTPFPLKGINGVNNSSATPPTNANISKTGFAFHSVQIALNDPNNVWVTTNSSNAWVAPATNLTQFNKPKSGGSNGIYTANTGYLSMPITINTLTGTQSSKTATLNFMVTSSMDFAQPSNYMEMANCWNFYQAPALGYGDGTNNYGWATSTTNETSCLESKFPYNNSWNVTQFLTIQGAGSSGGSNPNAWVPVLTASGAISQPNFLNTAALAYPNFSTTSGVTVVPGINYDLVAYLQSGDYADYSLIFMAVPTQDATLAKAKAKK